MNVNFLTLDEVAGILRISNSTAYKLIRNLHLPAFKVGKQWRVQTEQLEAWLHRNRVSSFN